MTTVSLPRPRRPLHIALINAVGGKLRQLGLRRPRLDLDSLQEATGLDARLTDADDRAFLERFRLLLQDAEGPAQLNFLGRIATRWDFVILLRNRLMMRQYATRHPEALQVPLERPLFVVGQARTGTTLLYNLLAQDPRAHAPRLWELISPMPPPDPANRDRHPRIKEVEDLLKWELNLAQVNVAHEVNVRGPEECAFLLECSAFSLTFVVRFAAPSYANHLKTASPSEARAAYEEFRRAIELLHHKFSESHWVSKSPAHLFFLDALLGAIPQACIVRTHRDPIDSIPSLCSLIAIGRSRVSDCVDLRSIGSMTLERYMEGSRRAEVAAANAGDRVLDVSYRRLTADPVGTVRVIYEYFGYPFTPELEDRLRAWLKANPQHKHGVHKYNHEAFGLDRDQILQATRDYRDKYLSDGAG